MEGIRTSDEKTVMILTEQERAHLAKALVKTSGLSADEQATIDAAVEFLTRMARAAR